MAVIDWGNNRLPVRCEYQPRAEYRGRALKPGQEAMRGRVFSLIALWKMGDEDKYPGEYALAGHGVSLFDELGIGWVASGDVVPVEGEVE